MQQQNGPNTSGQYVSALTILCFALIAGIVIFSGITLFIFLVQKINHPVPQLAKIFSIISASITMICLYAGMTLFKNKKLAAKEMGTLGEKLNAYRAAVILFYALLEGPALFSVIAFFLTGELRVFVAVAASLIVMLQFVPNRQRIIKDLELSSGETDVIKDPNGLIE